MALNPTETLKAIVISIEANLPLNLFGRTGIGKSAMVRQAAQKVEELILNKEGYLYETTPEFQELVAAGKFNTRVEDIRMAHMDISDWGIPQKFYEIKTKEGIKRVPQEFITPDMEIDDIVHASTRPHWWPREDHEGLFILFMDEMNRGDNVAINGAMEIAAERSLRGRKAPSHVRLLAACNPATGGFQVNELDEAMKARWAHIAVITNSEAYLNNRWDYVGEITRTLLLLNNDGIERLQKPLDEDYNDWELANEIEHCPRTWEMHNKLVTYMEWQTQKNPNWIRKNEDVLRSLTSGLIGETNSISWWNQFQEKRWFPVASILDGTETYQSIANYNESAVTGMIFKLRQSLADHMFLNDPNKLDSFIDASKIQNFERFTNDVYENHKELGVALFNFLLEKSNKGKNNKIISHFMNASKVITKIRNHISDINDDNNEQL